MVACSYISDEILVTSNEPDDARETSVGTELFALNLFSFWSDNQDGSSPS